MKAPIVALVVLTGLVVGGYFVDRARAERRSVLSGTFESQPSRLAPKIAGRVSRILVREGDSVVKGQTLVVLTAPDTAYQTAASEAQARQAAARESEVVSGTRTEQIVRQRAAVAEAAANVAKLENGSLPEEIRAAEEKARQARARLDQLLRGARPEEKAAAQAAVRQAYARFQMVRRGPTPEERLQLQARTDAARSSLDLAQKEYARKKTLAEQGALPVNAADQAGTQVDTAQAALQEATEALRRAQLGGPPEETAQALAAYRQTQSQLQLVLAGPRKEEIEAARAELGVAEQNLRLVRQGPRKEDREAAASRLRQARALLSELEHGSRIQQIQQAKAAASAAEAQANAAKSLLAETKVAAPTAGVVERILVADGDLASTGNPVVQFTDPTDIWLRVYVPEDQLPLVRVGDRATLAVDGIDGSVAARVESIATQGEFTPANLQTPEERGKQVFAVRLRLAQADARIKAGMSATVKEMGRWR